MCKSRSWPAILPLLLAALAMRAIVPSGWMFDETAEGVLQVRICTPPAAKIAATEGMQHVAMDHAAMGHGPMAESDTPIEHEHPSNPETMNGLCAFAVAGVAALEAPPPEIAMVERDAQVALLSWQATETPRIALRLRPPGRAPPVRA